MPDSAQEDESMRFGMRTLIGSVLVLSLLGPGCRRRTEHPQTSAELQIEKVVLYRNGVGYFDYIGHVDDGKLSLRVPREHLNDILKSLTVVDPHGQVLRVSMPLDATAFQHQDAYSQDQLHETLRALRGTPVALALEVGFDAQIQGRIFMVEALHEPLRDPEEDPDTAVDYRVSLINEAGIVSARLSQVVGIELLDQAISLSLNRALDSSSGKGSLQLVDVDIFLSDSGPRDVSVSYVVEAPIWKPTYRVVIPGDGMKEVLLQGWAVVHNMSGGDWDDVQMSLAAGAPIAFRYDMHRPSRVTREDLSWMERQKKADVAIGDASAQAPSMDKESADGVGMSGPAPREEEVFEEAADMESPAPTANKRRARKKAQMERPQPAPAPSLPALSKSVPASRESTQVAGLTKISLGRRLTIPQGRSSMLAFVNERVPGKAALLFRAGGAGPGYANHPYRVLRFQNQTQLLLESGPISLYAGGTFVGEGIAEPIGSGAWATIPYAVETGVEVVSDIVEEESPLRVMRISSGVLEVEQFSQNKLTWRVQGSPKSEPRSIYIDQRKSGPRYELVSPSPKSSQVEVFPDFYRLHLEIPANEQRASLDVVEKTPSRFSLSIWDTRAVELLELALSAGDISAEARAKLSPLVKQRRALAELDTKLESLSRLRSDLEFHAEQVRRNLKAIAKDRAAKELRRKLNQQLLERSNKIDKIGREIVELRSERLAKRLELEAMIGRMDLELVPPRPSRPRPVAKPEPALKEGTKVPVRPARKATAPARQVSPQKPSLPARPPIK